MSALESDLATAVRIEVSPDRLLAQLWIDPERAPEGVSRPVLVEQLRKSGLVISKERLMALAGTGQLIRLPQPVVIAQGRPPEHGSPGEITLLTVAPPADAPDSQSHYHRCAIITAVAGQKIATYSPTKCGRDGLDVYGQPIAYQPNTAPPATLGANVRLEADGSTVVAVSGGRVRLEDRRLTIDTALNISGSVDFSTGNIDFPGDVQVGGSVVDLFRVRSGGSLTVAGAVEAADVVAQQDLIVGGSIAGKDKGHCLAHRNISARHITNALVRAGNDVTVATEIANSRIICGGKLRIDRGAIIGGHVTAAGGVICRMLGSTAGTTTLVELGIEQQLRDECGARLAEVADQRKQAEHVRGVVEPLLRNSKHLTAQQKEKATELLYNASELEAKASSALQALRAAYESMQARSKAEAQVTGLLHVGTVIRFPGIEAVVEATMRGPLRVARRGQEGNWQICVFGGSGSVVVLKARSFVDKNIQALAQALRAA